MTNFTKRDIIVDGIRVQILEAGEGEPVVFFHGAGTTSGFQDLLPLAQAAHIATTDPDNVRALTSLRMWQGPPHRREME